MRKEDLIAIGQMLRMDDFVTLATAFVAKEGYNIAKDLGSPGDTILATTVINQGTGVLEYTSDKINKGLAAAAREYRKNPNVTTASVLVMDEDEANLVYSGLLATKSRVNEVLPGLKKTALRLNKIRDALCDRLSLK